MKPQLEKSEKEKPTNPKDEEKPKTGEGNPNDPPSDPAP